MSEEAKGGLFENLTMGGVNEDETVQGTYVGWLMHPPLSPAGTAATRQSCCGTPSARLGDPNC